MVLLVLSYVLVVLLVANNVNWNNVPCFGSCMFTASATSTCEEEDLSSSHSPLRRLSRCSIVSIANNNRKSLGDILLNRVSFTCIFVKLSFYSLHEKFLYPSLSID